jgi:hypothetical protein
MVATGHAPVAAATLICGIDEWDELFDELNLWHGVVMTSIFVTGTPLNGRSNNEMTGHDRSTHGQCGKA